MLTLMFSRLVSFFAPEPCCVCTQGVHPLCASCRSALGPVDERGALWSVVQGIPLCTSTADPEILMAVLRALKDHAQTSLAMVLARIMGGPLGAALVAYPNADAVAVIPASSRAWRARGFHPVSLVLRKLGVTAQPALVRARSWSDQRGLDTAARAANMAGAFAATRACSQRSFVLVDDVVTSGATIAEATRAITAGGGHVLCVVALSRVRLRRHAETN